MNIQGKNLGNNIYFLKFDNQYELTITMLRFQEFYESKYTNILHKYFTLEEYMDTYAADKGNFTYCYDWVGFNIPSNSLISFLKVFKEKMREKELQVIELLSLILISGKKFYVIAGYDEKVIVHEMAHALYYSNKKYRKDMNTLLKTLPEDIINRFSKALTKATYNKHVHMDEIQAYCVDNYYSQKNQLPNMKIKKSDKKYFKQFYNLFKGYYNE